MEKGTEFAKFSLAWDFRPAQMSAEAASFRTEGKVAPVSFRVGTCRDPNLLPELKAKCQEYEKEFQVTGEQLARSGLCSG